MEVHQQKTVKERTPCHEENSKSTKKPDAIELSIQKLTRKIFEAELFQKIAEETKVKLKQEEQEEINGIRKLEEMQYKKLERMENFCDKIWKLSTSNDLCTVFSKYLDMPKHAHHKFLAFEVDLDPNISKLKKERDELKMDLVEKNSTCQNLEKNLTELKMQLQVLEFYRYNDPKIMSSLEKSIEDSQSKIESVNLKISKIEMGILEKNEKWEYVVDGIDDKKIEFVRASELIGKPETIETKKKSNFSVKKESDILRKISKLRVTNRSE